MPGRSGSPERGPGRRVKVQAGVEVVAGEVVVALAGEKAPGSMTRVTYNASSARTMDIMPTTVQGRRKRMKPTTLK